MIDAIKQHLAKTGMSVPQLAKLLGVSRWTVLSWVKGSRAPSYASIIKLVSLLGLQILEAQQSTLNKERARVWRIDDTT